MLRQTKTADNRSHKDRSARWRDYIPGIALCLVISALSLAIQSVETHVFSHPYVDVIVLAILLGMVIRAVWQPGQRWQPGIAFSAKQLLEIAVMLLGASLSLAAIAASGSLLLMAVVATVAVALAFSYGVSRMLGLSIRMSILIACGNSICGNSAIAAVAPVIRASGDDVGASISFTAILGVLTVIGLPLFIPLLNLTASQYGILAGLTVYAVPQVLAATLPVGLVSVQIGTLVKLLRVLMLGPVVIALTIFAKKIRSEGAMLTAGDVRNRFTWVPWFIPGFLFLSAARSFDLIPHAAILPIAKIAGFLTVVSMAALGLGVDLKLLGRIGARVTAAVSLSLVVLISISLALVHLF